MLIDFMRNYACKLNRLFRCFTKNVEVLQTEKIFKPDGCIELGNNALGRYPSFLYYLALLLSIYFRQLFLRLHFNNNTGWISQSHSYEFGYCVGIRHCCTEQSGSALFGQVSKNFGQSRLESQVQQPVYCQDQEGAMRLRTYRSASSRTRTSSSFTFTALRPLPRRNSSIRPGVPTITSAPEDRNRSTS